MDVHSPKAGKISLAAGLIWALLLIATGNIIIFILGLPAVAALLSIPLVGFVSWLLGPRLRRYIHGEGRQLYWGYLGHTVRGQRVEREVDGETREEIWISVRDCSSAAGIDLTRLIDRVADDDKCEDKILGWLVSHQGILRILDNYRGDFVAPTKLRLFLDREVWQTRRG